MKYTVEDMGSQWVRALVFRGVDETVQQRAILFIFG